jgi:CheY-like chemotaxis protein
MRPRAIEKGIEFKIVEVGSLPAQIHSDPTRLQQCLINLIGNAMKFTEEGHVHVNVSMEDIGDQSHIRFDVEDTGIGIPKDKQAKIFESFTQADGDTTRKYGGTGLGLSITRQLAGIMGGELTLTSEDGVGTTFTLLIPVGIDIVGQPLMDRKKTIEYEMEYPVFSANVLVAEDDLTNQTLIKILLENFGFEVTIVGDGKEAMEKVLAGQFDIVFMDMQMPHMNGYDATRKLRKKGITMPIVALTANAMTGDKEKCFKAGCDEYLAKPVNRVELVELLNSYFTPVCQETSSCSA